MQYTSIKYYLFINRTKFCYFLKKIKNKKIKDKNKTNKCIEKLINAMYYYNKINNLSNN